VAQFYGMAFDLGLEWKYSRKGAKAQSF
jgi:hypothetical protein